MHGVEAADQHHNDPLKSIAKGDDNQIEPDKVIYRFLPAEHGGQRDAQGVPS